MTKSSNSSTVKNIEQLLDAFRACGWSEILDQVGDRDYVHLAQAFLDASAEAREKCDDVHSYVLRLIALACSMWLSNNDPHKPFESGFVIRGKQSITPDGFTEDEIGFFTAIIDCIDHPLLKARLADLIWLRHMPRDPKFVIIAIDNYIQFPLNSTRWHTGGHQCWHRAIGLSRIVRPITDNKLNEIESLLIKEINSVTAKFEVPVLQLADALKSNGLGNNQANMVANKLEHLACQIVKDGNYDSGSHYYSAAAEWFAYSGDDDKCVDMIVAQAETLAKEATARATSDKPSFGIAASLLERAIQVFRTIPGVQRNRHGVDARIQELMVSLSEYGELAQSQMIEIGGTPFDVSDWIQQAREAVSDKSINEALRKFTNLYRISVESLREEALASLRKTTFRNLVSSVVLSRDGRVVCKVPSITGQVPTDEDEVVVRVEMNRYYTTIVNVVAQALILPALEILTLEHRLTSNDFVQLARQSPVVPIGRQRLYGNALSFGFKRRFWLRSTFVGASDRTLSSFPSQV